MSNEEKITIWQAKNNLNYRDVISPTDPQFVDLTSARGDYQLQKKLYDELGLDGEGKLHNPPKDKYILFTGHIGCGKSTELARIAKHLNAPERYYVLTLDCLKTLDINNLKYSDVLLGLASVVLSQLQEEKIHIDDVHLTKLKDWFNEHIITHEKLQKYESELTAGVKAEAGLPFVAKLFATLTNKIHIGATYREDVREVVRNTSSELIAIFNELTRTVEEKIIANKLGERLVFTIDGTDRLDSDDSQRFFIEDINQLTQISGIFIYCAPIHLLHTHNVLLNARFDQIVRLPMLKVRDRENNDLMDNYGVIREMIYKRVPDYLFDNEETLNQLIRYSGGHIRDLLRLVNYACNYREGDIIDSESADRAIEVLGKEYQRQLKTEDYQLLVEIDNHPEKPDDYTSEKSRYMLRHLILLEYNDYFWKSHPVITKLRGYQQAQKAYQQEKEAQNSLMNRFIRLFKSKDGIEQ